MRRWVNHRWNGTNNRDQWQCPRSSPLDASTAASLTLRHLTLKNGYNSTSGGAIYNRGDLIIDDCALTYNRADDDGGAIYTERSLTISGSTLSHNSTDTGDGGAIYIITDTEVTISSSTFQENYAIISGGAIYNIGMLTIADSAFFLNRADFGNGGAIYYDPYNAEIPMNIERSTIALNSAHYGGAIYSSKGRFSIYETSINYNVASFSGGGIFIERASSTSSINHSTFDTNSATINGGAIDFEVGGAININVVLFQNNQADNNGGAIYNNIGEVDLYRSTIKSNEAGQDGGGIYNLRDIFIGWNTFSGNQAVRNGGALYHGAGANSSNIENNTFYKNSAAQGGGIYSVSDLYITNCTLSANSASTTGGAVYGNNNTVIANSILANSPSPGNCDNIGTKPWDSGNNIDSGATCGWGATRGSMSNTNPQLGPLQHNGGPTKTMALLAVSPAIDAVIYNAPNGCPDDDQRGYPRPFGLRCDIGAFERYYQLYMPQVIKH